MPRDIPVGNGNILIAFDKNYLIRDFYFPHVGQENHGGHDPFRFGIWVDGEFCWFPHDWDVQRDYLNDSLVTDVTLTHERLKLHLTINDLVDFHENIYLKRISVANLSDHVRDVRLFLCHDFNIYSNEIGDTAAYRPDVKGIVHYKNERYFLINTLVNKQVGIDYFATGNKVHGRFEGTWKDAEDGHLSGNPIAQGSVDSTVAIHMNVPARGGKQCYYWICVGKSWDEVSALNEVICKKSPRLIFKRTLDYWRLWTNKENLNLSLLPEKLAWLYKRSLLVARTQIDNFGSIIAANDSDVVHFNRDTYSYMWPRDGALVAYAFDLAGYSEITRRFYNHCGRIIEREGYFLHKYTPSGALASSWHPWMKDKHSQLPIQEDETALVIWALWKHYELFRDIEFIKPLYKPLIKNAADMMMGYRDDRTGLPLPSYDLWEERQGILTFTVAAVYGGLMAAANFTEAFGETDLTRSYRRGAQEVRQAMDEHLYLQDKNRFARMINFDSDGKIEVDSTIDASLYGIFAFGAYSARDEKVKNTMTQVYEKLWCKTEVGGLARYQGDDYHRVSTDIPGNPWFITTLWLAQYRIACAANRKELDEALDIMEWVAERALSSGVLAEQVNPFSNEPLSVSPLTWSHATFVMSIHEYLDKLLDIEKCAACGQPIYNKRGP